MGHPMRTEPTCECLLVKLANYYTNRGTLLFMGYLLRNLHMTYMVSSNLVKYL